MSVNLFSSLKTDYNTAGIYGPAGRLSLSATVNGHVFLLARAKEDK